MELAALIKQARHDARVTQQELARRVGRSRASIAQLESGVRTPSFGSLQAILAALGKQVRLELEPLDADVRREIVEHRHDPELAGRVYFAVEQIEDLAGLDFRIEGLAAAALLGAPLKVGDPSSPSPTPSARWTGSPPSCGTTGSAFAPRAGWDRHFPARRRRCTT